MRIGIPKEKNEKETRVAIVPVSVPKLSKLGFEVIIEKNAGKKSGYSNAEYEEKGAKISSIEDVMKSELIASIDVPDFSSMKKGQMLACVADPFRNLEQTKKIIDAGITLLSLEVIPEGYQKVNPWMLTLAKIIYLVTRLHYWDRRTLLRWFL